MQRSESDSVIALHGYRSSIIGVEEIAPQDSRSYGIVFGREWEEAIVKLAGIIEKPAPEDAPSNLGVSRTHTRRIVARCAG